MAGPSQHNFILNLGKTNLRPVVSKGNSTEVGTSMIKRTGKQPSYKQTDLSQCRAAEMTRQFASCQSNQATVCEYAMPWGFKYLCGHPFRKAIIENTKGQVRR